MLQCWQVGQTFSSSQQFGQILGMFWKEYSIHIALEHSMNFTLRHLSINSLEKIIATLFHKSHLKICSEYYALSIHFLIDHISYNKL